MQKLSGMAAELMGSAPPAEEPPQAEPPEPPAQLTNLLSALSQNSADCAGTERAQLLHALGPFLSDRTRAQIAHAERIASMARMAKAASGQLFPPDGAKEV